VFDLKMVKGHTHAVQGRLVYRKVDAVKQAAELSKSPPPTQAGSRTQFSGLHKFHFNT